MSGEDWFYPSRRGGHKNSENVSTFSDFLRQEDKLSPARTDFSHTRGAVGKRYDRGLSGEAGHGVPGVLLPSQTRSGNIDERKRGAKTAPAPTTSRHTSRQPEPPGKHFHPPQTKPPSQYRQNAPISTTIPISGGRFGRWRAQPHREGENVTQNRRDR